MTKKEWLERLPRTAQVDYVDVDGEGIEAWVWVPRLGVTTRCGWWKSTTRWWLA